MTYLDLGSATAMG